MDAGKSDQSALKSWFIWCFPIQNGNDCLCATWAAPSQEGSKAGTQSRHFCPGQPSNMQLFVYSLHQPGQSLLKIKSEVISMRASLFVRTCMTCAPVERLSLPPSGPSPFIPLGCSPMETFITSNYPCLATASQRSKVAELTSDDWLSSQLKEWCIWLIRFWYVN